MNTSSKTKGHKVEIVKRGPGRPVGDSAIQWNRVNLMWRSKTDKEIATFLGCSVVGVFLHRQKMIKAGKNVACTKPRYTRAKVVA